MTRVLHPHPVLTALAPTALALTACGAATQKPDNATATLADDYAAKVAALPTGQRDGVLFRAIRDAGRTCQQVTRSQPVDAVAGAPAWAATCDDGGVWVVALNPGRIATVTSASDAAKAGGR